MTVRVVVADDHPMVRYGLRAVLDAAEETEVVGEAATGRELLSLAATERPDVVVTDVAMPDLDGVSATRQLRAMRPEVAVLVLTMHEDDETLLRAVRAGASGYLVKGAGGPEVLRAVLAVAAGEAVYGSGVARRVAALLSGPDGPAAEPFPQLTPRERDVLALIGAGARNSEIAARLGMADKTVRNHVSAVLVKLGLPDRTSAALAARDAGLRPGATGP